MTSQGSRHQYQGVIEAELVNKVSLASSIQTPSHKNTRHSDPHPCVLWHVRAPTQSTAINTTRTTLTTRKLAPHAHLEPRCPHQAGHQVCRHPTSTPKTGISKKTRAPETNEKTSQNEASPKPDPHKLDGAQPAIRLPVSRAYWHPRQTRHAY